MEARNRVGGRWLAGGVRREVRNPANVDEIVGCFFEATEEEVGAAIGAASGAAPGWASTPLAERCEALRQMAAEVEKRSAVDGWPTLLTREQGKIIPESIIELSFVSLLTEYCTSVADDLFAEERLEDGAGRRVRSRKPFGVVAAITPWNWPVTLSAMKLIPALLCGNTIVIKPAPTAPLTVTLMIDAMVSMLPAGVVNLVHGDAAVGTLLTRDPAVRKVSFTGSIPTGRLVMQHAAETVKNVNLELGGNDPAILLDDVVVDDGLAEAILTAAFTTTGQVCMAIKRLYVHESRHEEIVDALCRAADRLVVGNGLDEESTLGPLNNRPQFERVTSLLADAERRGANLHILGQVLDPAGWDNGFFIRPTIVTDIDDHAPIVAEEQFGPALPVLSFSSEEEVLTRANATEYGLCGSVWSADEDRAFALADQLEAGVKFVNAHGLPALDLSCPNGGVKQSGVGRILGIDGIREFTECSYVTNRIH
jgi:aldehyde dehydrogenase